MNNLLTDSFELPRRDSSRDADIEMGMHQPDASYNLKDFLKKVDAIESLIAKLTNLLNKLQTANEESKAVTKASSMKAIKQRMEKGIDEVGKIARQAKTKVDELEKDNLSNRQKPGCGKGSAVDRSREQTTGAVKKKLKERMNDFQVTPAGYSLMTSLLAGCSNGRLLVILEGGYNLRSISSSATEVVKVLLGDGPKCASSVGSPSKDALRTVSQVLKIQQQFWPVLGPTYASLQAQLGSVSPNHITKGNELKKRKHSGGPGPFWWKLGSKRLLYEALFERRLQRKIKGFGEGKATVFSSTIDG